MDRTTLSPLRTGFLLRGSAYTYHIEKVLGQGSFGITYLATTKASITGPLGNIETEIKVAVKEFFMKEFSSRHEDGTVTEMTDGSLVQNYAKKFRREAENLAKLSHPNIVNVLEVFDANHTCYYAMQYMEGGSLDEYVRSRGGLSEDEAKECIRQIGEAVSYVHEHRMLHLDLKPSNVMRSGDGSRMVLIDFGLSKQYEENGIPESSTTVGLGTPGYAPLEQSSADRDRDFAPTLDVYALGATYYKLLTGQTPPKASDVNDEGLPVDVLRQRGVSQTGIIAIERAMEPRKSRRLETVSSFLSLLSGDGCGVVIRLDRSSLTLVEGSSARLSAEIAASVGSDSEKTEINERSNTLFWHSSSPDIVTVDARGELKALRPGVGEITAKYGDAAAECRVTVEPRSRPKVPGWILWSVRMVAALLILFLGLYYLRDRFPKLTGINLSVDTLSLDEGCSDTLAVSFQPAEASHKSVRWVSSAPNVVSVDAEGHITGLKYGEAAVTASCGAFQRSCAVTVEAATTVNGVTFRMKYVPGGTFEMGATSEQGSDADSDESPVHRVTLDSYLIGETEVTQALWTAVMGSNPSWFTGDELPVEEVSWNDCQDFIRKLNSLTGKNFRLPTEAEWEYAARGGDRSRGCRYSGGSIGDVAWYVGNSGGRTHPVKRKMANELGIYDMSGNVREWCQDRYGSYSGSPQTNPDGASSGPYRVYRGGCWGNDAGYCRVSTRSYYSADDHAVGLGFRLALQLMKNGADTPEPS